MINKTKNIFITAFLMQSVFGSYPNTAYYRVGNPVGTQGSATCSYTTPPVFAGLPGVTWQFPAPQQGRDLVARGFTVIKPHGSGYSVQHILQLRQVVDIPVQVVSPDTSTRIEEICEGISDTPNSDHGYYKDTGGSCEV